jgi:hypothetical protein
MATSLPFMTGPGALPKILTKICEAAVPESFNYNFLGTKLGFPGGNQKTFISWAKKCGFLTTDGTPTQIYKNFRNTKFRGQSMAEALKKGYAELYLRNEYVHDLSRQDFTKLVSEVTGGAHDSSTVKAIVGTFFFAKEFAEFEANGNETPPEENSNHEQEKEPAAKKNIELPKKVNLGLSYTINLVLPKTDDPAILNAIFKALKENLLHD